jgi:Putative zinc-finger
LSKHEHFKKLSALAALGEIPPAEARELDEHLAACEQCRQVRDEYFAVHLAMIPPPGTDDVARIDALKAATWEWVATGLKDVSPTLPSKVPETVRVTQRTLSLPIPTRWAFASAMILVLGGFWFGVRYESAQKPAEGVVFVWPKRALPEAKPPLGAQTKQGSDPQLAKALKSEKSKNHTLLQLLSTKNRQLDQVLHDQAGLRQQIESDSQALKYTQTALATKIAELKQAEDKNSANTASLVAMRYQVQELTDKLDGQSVALKQERDLLAGGREIRDIIGARNLHIVDVYDTDATGRTKKAFARAFYTEGKSLVFYAYDLPHRSDDADYRYVAWGQKNGRRSTIKHLGILINDDKGQKRWMLSFNDPKVLAEIDSVFITLEPSHQDPNKPSGKRMLTAYLNDQVNHP